MTIYLGSSRPQRELLISGKFVHKRTASAKYGTASLADLRKMLPGVQIEWAPLQWKHLYAMPLDRAMRRQITPSGLPYPRPAVEGSEESRPGSTG